MILVLEGLGAWALYNISGFFIFTIQMLKYNILSRERLSVLQCHILNIIIVNLGSLL